MGMVESLPSLRLQKSCLFDKYIIKTVLCWCLFIYLFILYMEKFPIARNVCREPRLGRLHNDWTLRVFHKGSLIHRLWSCMHHTLRLGSWLFPFPFSGALPEGQSATLSVVTANSDFLPTLFKQTLWVVFNVNNVIGFSQQFLRLVQL